MVAVSLFALIGIAALAIDLTTLYVARGEMQRAADAAALAGAKAFVESETTTAPQDPIPRTSSTDRELLYCNVIQQNRVAACSASGGRGATYILAASESPTYGHASTDGRAHFFRTRLWAKSCNRHGYSTAEA